MRRPLTLIAVAAILVAIGVIAWQAFIKPPQTVTLRVAAGERTGDAYRLMSEIGEVLERHTELVRLQVLETEGPSQNLSMVNTGRAELAAIQSDAPAVISTQLVARLFPDAFLLITWSDSDVLSPPDLSGKRIALPPHGTSEQRAFWAVADHYDINPFSINWLALPGESALKKMLDHEVDAVFLVRSLRDPAVLRFFEDAKLLKRGRLRLVAIDQAEAMTLKRPFLKASTLVKGAFDGEPPLPPTSIVTAGVDLLLVATPDASEEAINELTRVMMEHRLDLAVRTPLAASITAPGRAESGLPIHAGAERYYLRDEPSFLQQNAEPMALIVTLAAMLVSGAMALRARLMADRKNNADKYNNDLLALSARAREAKDVGELAACKTELTAILEQCVVDLDTDEVTEAGFQSFSLLWEAVRTVIEDRVRDISATS
ncbi:MAG: TAXI family TRAP transporter solute-binding subunit [Rhodobiaceae bacterium]|nr:TAXI family TRAP transporter solute-binding subunit [Rhodobiaceae bacterium]MCC0012510.1 TAXI family TRAP transporter solute-binding subunit [Rhodobiaceae bacterium]MCC0061717.1 TAXI family TRAP transporter solute-binding subunit [Rhodobiaceae bacterium]